MKLETESATCKYCGKSFRAAKTLLRHMCEKKRRYEQQGETGVQLGLRSYLRFYELTQGSSKSKCYDDFVASPYYSAFVRFGQYLVTIRAIGIEAFIDWTIKNNTKLDKWTQESFYDTFLYELLRKEHPNDALERSFKEMQRWADENEKPFNDLFREGSPNKVCNMIVNGRISPWIIYNCDSGVEFLRSLDGDQIKLIFKLIEPNFWSNKFKDFVADTEFIKMVLREAKV